MPSRTTKKTSKVTILRDALRDWDVVVGEITSPHGLKGEVKVFPHTDFEERFAVGAQLCLVSTTGRRRLVTIQKSRRAGRLFIVKLEGTDSIEDAQSLRGFQLCIHKDARPPLRKGEFLEKDILGLEVVTTDGRGLGRITEIVRTGAADVYVTDAALIPATKEVIKRIDLKRKQMLIEPIPGLLD